MTESTRCQSTHSTTILIVDDDPAALLLCRKFLEQEGRVVLEATGSSEALKLHAQHTGHIDLVIADIMLPPPDFQLSIGNNPFPRVNGLELVDRLLESQADVRLLLMSSTSRTDLLQQGLIRPDLPFIHKPFTADAFRALVCQTLAGPPAKMDPKKRRSGDVKEVNWFG